MNKPKQIIDSGELGKLTVTPSDNVHTLKTLMAIKQAAETGELIKL
ncbi:hypothetical protein [Lentilactobacillus parabuchneri]